MHFSLEFFGKASKKMLEIYYPSYFQIIALHCDVEASGEI